MSDGTVLPSTCRLCPRSERLVLCPGCNVTYYCGQEHQSADRERHRPPCEAVGTARICVDGEGERLRAMQGEGDIPLTLFETEIGRFGAHPEAHEYLRLQLELGFVLLHNFAAESPTVDNVQATLDAFREVLRLDRNQQLMAHHPIPVLQLRLGRDQEAYDFVKWYATTGEDAGYDWNDTSLPFLDVRGADVFEPPEHSWLKVGEPRDYCHCAVVVLIKLRICIDLVRIQKASRALHGLLPPEIIKIVCDQLVIGSVVRGNPKILHGSIEDNGTLLHELKAQVRQIVDSVDRDQPFFWDVLVQPEDALVQMQTGAMSRERQLAFHAANLLGDVFDETPHALTILNLMVRDARERAELQVL